MSGSSSSRIGSDGGGGRVGLVIGAGSPPLARSAAGIQAMLQATTNAMLVIGNDTRVTDFNDRFVAMWSLPPDVVRSRDRRLFLEWIGRSFADPQAHADRVASINSGDPPSTDVLTLLDGRVIERHSSPQVLGARTVGRVWSFVDVTERLKKRQLPDEEAQLIAWLDRTALSLSSSLEPQAVIEAVTHATTGFCGARFGWFIPHPGLEEPRLSTAFTSTSGDAPGRSVVLEIKEAARRLLALRGTGESPPTGRGLLLVPVAARPDRVLGAFAFATDAPGGFAERIQRLIGALASHVAVAVDNARLHAQLRNESNERTLLSNLQKRSTERLQNVSRRLMQAEEEERKRLGRELHDRIGGNLSALGMGLELLRQQLPHGASGAVGKRLGDLGDILADTVAHVRDALADLRPTALDDLGLVPALRHQAGVLTARSGIRFDATGGEPSPRLPPECEIAFYRVAQEACANAMKHSRARSVAVSVRHEEGRVTMTVEDDGCGFEPSALPAGSASLGLTTMRERAEAIGAALEVEATTGAGVVVRMSLAHAGGQ